MTKTAKQSVTLATTPAPEAEFEQTRAPLMEHLLELRRRLMISVAAFFTAFLVCFYFAEPIYRFLVEPLAASYPDPSSRRLIYTGLTEAFMTYVQLGLFGALFLSFPVLAFQLYRFIAPGLYRREKRVVWPFLVAAPLLFVAGAALAYYYIFPMAWQFFVSFETTGKDAGGLPIVLEARVSEYLSLVMQILIAFGAAFQLPVVLTLLARAGFVKSDSLARGRKYALIAILTVAAVLTPPDVLSQIGLSIPLYLLYECSILTCRWVERSAGTDEKDEAHEA